MSFERCVLDLVMLARLMADLDMPMDEHECMIEAVDAVRHERSRGPCDGVSVS
jgi:hypothetical protein